MDVILQALIYGMALTALYLPVAVGLNLIFGVLRILNFAHGDLYMLSGMCIWYLLESTGIGFAPALLLSTLLVTVLGILIERLLLRPMGAQVLPALIVSIGIGLVLQTSTLLIAGSDIRTVAMPIPGVVRIGNASLSIGRLVISLLGMAGVAAFYVLLQKTKLGRSIRAVAQDAEAATFQGIDPSRIKLIAMGLGTALAAMGGALAASVFGVDPIAGSVPMVFSFVVIVLGGLGSIEGTLVAGLTLGLVESLITVYVGATEAVMASFIVLYLVLLLKPGGIMGRRRLTGGYL